MLTEWQCPACLEVYDVEPGQPTPAVCPECAGQQQHKKRSANPMVKWRCPGCQRVIEIPTGADPLLCPQCEAAAPAPPRQLRPSQGVRPTKTKQDFSDVDRAAGFAQTAAYVAGWIGVLVMLLGMAWAAALASTGSVAAATPGVSVAFYGLLLIANAAFGYALAGGVRVLVDIHRLQ